ncbi:MAG: trypsin-like peptidase domain-containing protein [Christensenellaceae bacterium]|jgi:S1-C subfamily serine protease|nr:trypsin-like peptidase domain-containing protein [Christensenellaceae bacterium]
MVKKRSSIIIVSLIVLLAAVLIMFYAVVIAKPSYAKIYQSVARQVVEVKAETGENIISYGSAVLINSDGYFISNAHVVTYTQMATQIEFERYYIRFSFEDEYREVDLIAYDNDVDMSILKLKSMPDYKLKPIKIAKTDKLKVGNEVLAVGNGMNHGIGLTYGHISLARVNIEYDERMHNVIQCDLIINEGNSGGALVSNKGKLLGLTTFRVKDSKGNPIYGIAFCIPSEDVMNYLDTNGINWVS